MAFSLDSIGPIATEPRAAAVGATRLALRFVALTVVTGTAGGVLQLGVPLLALSLGATSAQVGLIRSVSGLGMLAAVLPVGFLVDRIGPRHIFRLGAVAGAALAVAYAAARSPLLLVLLMALEGLLAPLRFTALAASFHGRLASIGLDKAGWFKAAMATGLTFLGPLAAGVLAGRAGFPALFTVVAALHVAAAALASAVEHAPRARGVASVTLGLRDEASELRALLRTVGIAPGLGAELLGAATFSAFSTAVVIVVVRVFGAGAAVASRVLIVEGLAFVATALAAPRLAAGSLRLSRAACIAGVAGPVAFALARGPISLAVAGALVGLATGVVHVHVTTWIATREGAKGRLSALFQVAAGVGLAVGPLATAAAERWLPTQATLLVLAPCFVALAWSAARAASVRTSRAAPPRGVAEPVFPHRRSSLMALERQQIPQYLDDTRFIVLSTVDGANAPATRTLASFASDGLTVYFSTGKASDKVHQIGTNPHVSILFQHEKQELPAFANVEIRGVAEVLAEGEERAKAIRLISRRNPRFKERAERGELSGSALVRVTPRKVKVVDFSRGIGPAAVSTIEV